MIDNRCVDSNCPRLDSPYFNLLTGNNYPVIRDKNCDNDKCMAYLYSSECEGCENQQCKDACRGNLANKPLLPRKSRPGQIYENQSQKSYNNVSIKTVTISKEDQYDPDPITVVKTEIKTITVDVPKRTDPNICEGECLSKKRTLRKSAVRKAPKNMKKTRKEISEAESNLESECSSTRKEGSYEKEMKQGIRKSKVYQSRQLLNESASATFSQSDHNVTVTQIVEKTKTVERPLTLYRELTTTLTVEKPLINYKVTTFTQFSTKIESVTITKIKGAEYTTSRQKIMVSDDKEPDLQLDSKVSTTKSKSSSSVELKTVEPKTVTIFTNSATVESPKQSIITITKSAEASSSSSTTSSLSVSKIIESSIPSISTVIQTVTVDVTPSSTATSISTVFRTVSKAIASTTLPASILEVKTEIPLSSVVRTVTKTVKDNSDYEIPKKSILTVSTITVTEREMDKPESTDNSILTSRIVKKKETSDAVQSKTQSSKLCNDLISCLQASKKYQKKFNLKSKGFEVTKAIAKGCETTMDSTREKPRTICRFVNLAKKIPTTSSAARKKRTVIKTVFADEDEECDNTVTKTVFA